MRNMHFAQHNISGHAIARRDIDYSHIVEFIPIDDIYVKVNSWNGPSNIDDAYLDLILVFTSKIKKIHGRVIWHNLCRSGYKTLNSLIRRTKLEEHINNA